eukprot:CAMPEP_0168287280 /NCGR_PEP_ID=MMETSP0142_2-20121227/2088_1 /TAXON_ID=44445 /ORGANISM="Pseudo-nitzschia australis, Strain 10249 10 AB" /LENGTH=79 /DNA_ID=CAMNT_0008232559 /DNA_START=312 /DNA_END=548 /DNA_ORIENTATION=+
MTSLRQDVVVADPQSLVNFIRKCCWLLGSQLCVGQYDEIAIAIAIAGSRSRCSCCGVAVVVLGRKDLLALLLIADASTL